MTQRIALSFVLAFAVAASSSSLVGCASPTEAEESSGAAAVSASERQAIMDALRATVKPELANQDILFDVSDGVFRSKGGWAWLQGDVVLRSGGEPSIRGTTYEEAAAEGLFDGFRIEALLQKDGSTWKVVEWGIGSTDVWYWGLHEGYPAAPQSIFPWLDGNADASVVVAQNERKAVMDALRATVKPELANQDVVFDVSRGAFKIDRDWVWLQGEVQLRGGGEPSVQGTSYEERAAEGLFDGFHIEALLHKDGNTWKVVEHGIGSTDVWWTEIEQRHPSAPRSIFPWLNTSNAP